jgi:predicted porin
MKSLYCGFLFVMCTSLVFGQTYPVPQETERISVNGYLAAYFAKSQSEGPYPLGSFQNPLLGLSLSGQPGPRVKYQAEAAFSDDDRFDIRQAWLGLQTANYLNLKLGLFVVPFGQFNESNLPHQTDTINLPLNIAHLFPNTWRDIGVTASGTLSGLQYAAYIGNGLAEGEALDSGQQFKDNNRNKAWGARLGFDMEEGISADYSYHRGKYDAADSRDQIMQAAAAAWITQDFYIRIEFNHARLETPEEFDDGEAWGYYVQTAMIWRNFRPVASYQVLDYNDAFHGPGFAGPDTPGEGITQKKTRWALGAVISLAPGAYFKFEYDINREKDQEIENNMFLFQLAVEF